MLFKLMGMILTLVNVLSANNTSGKPRLILANTVKGKGISFAENQAGWHHKVPTAEQYQQGLDELNAEIGRLSHE